MEGRFGVRIENVVYTKKIEDKEFVEIVDLTMIPIQKKMIDFSQLEPYQVFFSSEFSFSVYTIFILEINLMYNSTVFFSGFLD